MYGRLRKRAPQDDFAISPRHMTMANTSASLWHCISRLERLIGTSLPAGAADAQPGRTRPQTLPDGDAAPRPASVLMWIGILSAPGHGVDGCCKRHEHQPRHPPSIRMSQITLRQDCDQRRSERRFQHTLRWQTQIVGSV